MLKKINHQGKEILYVDYRGCKNEEEMIEILLEAQKTVIEDNKPYLQLTNLSNSYPTYNYISKAKQVAKETPKIAIKRAIVGIDSPARRVLLKGYNLIVGGKGLQPFNTEAEALDWLVK